MLDLFHCNSFVRSNVSWCNYTGSKRGVTEIGIRAIQVEHTMATRGRRGVGLSRGDESAGDSQAPAQQAQQQAQDQTGVPLPPPPPPVDYGTLMQGLVHAMQTQAQTTAAL
ncbi:hypothetical protein Taro_011748 [Colocasia esculenta]|uniref:Uncharacterized protein n=1 Tax=Colocasia esculenta TaxID=4460 RepID=A0A843UBJ2_COLES|nr:hypothetical protein [Colocasia esculenta]